VLVEVLVASILVMQNWKTWQEDPSDYFFTAFKKKHSYIAAHIIFNGAHTLLLFKATYFA